MNSLDLRGLKCPLPALMARRALRRAGAGAVIDVLTDDPMAPIDVPHMCRQEGFEVIETVTDNGMTRMRLARPGSRRPVPDIGGREPDGQAT